MDKIKAVVAIAIGIMLGLSISLVSGCSSSKLEDEPSVYVDETNESTDYDASIIERHELIPTQD